MGRRHQHSQANRRITDTDPIGVRTWDSFILGVDGAAHVVGGRHLGGPQVDSQQLVFIRHTDDAEEVDEDAAAEDNDSVNERMAGWYAGDLGSIMPRRRDS